MDLEQSSSLSLLFLLLPLMPSSPSMPLLSWSSSTAPGKLHVFDVWHVPIYLADRLLDPNQTSGEGVEGPEGYTLEHE